MTKSEVYGASYVMPVTLCPSCGKAHNRAGWHHGRHHRRKPKPGDIGVCNWCLVVNVYDEQLRLRLPTTAEKAELDADPKVRAARSYLMDMKALGLPVPPSERKETI